jgi:hypothetical protein
VRLFLLLRLEVPRPVSRALTGRARSDGGVLSRRGAGKSQRLHRSCGREFPPTADRFWGMGKRVELRRVFLQGNLTRWKTDLGFHCSLQFMCPSTGSVNASPQAVARDGARPATVYRLEAGAMSCLPELCRRNPDLLSQRLRQIGLSWGTFELAGQVQTAV